MHGNLMIPYCYQSQTSAYFLRLNERGELCLNRSTNPGHWQSDEVLWQDCRRFTAAPSADDVLHVIALNGKSSLCHFHIDKTGTREIQFPIQKVPAHFTLAFSSTGNGHFFCGGANNGQLVSAVFNHTEWQQVILPYAEKLLIPVSLCIDTTGSIHLLIYDLKNGNILYCHSNALGQWAEPFILASSIKLSTVPSLWLDTKQNLYAAWFVPQTHNICCRTKADGWQEQILPVDTPLQLLSFIEQDDNIILWYTGLGTGIHTFIRQNANWLQSEHETNFRQPVRQGFPGSEWINMADKAPADSFAFKVPVHIPPPQEAPPPTPAEDDENERLLVSTIKSIIQEKNDLKALLCSKEESLALMRQRLEQTQNNFQLKRQEWNDKLHTAEKSSRSLQEMLKKREEEVRSLKALLESTKKQLADEENERKVQQAEIIALREKYSDLHKREAKLQASLKELEYETSNTKSTWNSFSSIFRKKQTDTPSKKN
jgi:hypothetical protein